MSGNPKRGTPAGKSPTTGDLPLTKEYEDNHARIFGDRKPNRGRWVYTDGGQALDEPIDVNAEWNDPGRTAPRRSEDEVYGSLTATDGTDISTRRKHRDYMKANGLSMAQDFTEHWKAAEKQRAAVLSGEADRKERREIIGRALHEARNGRLRAPKLERMDDE